MDCRDDDVKGGKIVGSLHLPDSQFDIKSIETIMKAIESKKSKDVNVVFHCMESARRGPRCARRFYEVMKMWDDHDSNIAVRVLIGGFDQCTFFSRFRSKRASTISRMTGIRNFYGTDMIEDYDDDYWGFEETRRLWKEKFHKDYERPEDQPETPWSEAGSAVRKDK